MSDGTIRSMVHDDGALALVMDRPDKGNALSRTMTDELAALFRSPPEGARFIVLEGAGADFCAGRDSPMPPAGARVSAADIRARVADPVLSFYQTVRDCPLPLITVVRGRAHGVGFALAALGDIVLADDSAQLAVPEMNRDIPPLLVGAALADRLPRVTLARAIFGRQGHSAAEAMAMHIVSEALTAAEMPARVAEWRGLLAQNSATVLGTVKRFLNAAPDLDFAMTREYATAAISAAVSERFLPKGSDK